MSNRSPTSRPEPAAPSNELSFQLLVESVADYAIFMLNPNGYVLTWNAGAERIKGYSRDEIIGRHFRIFYPQEAIDRRWPEEELERAAAAGRFEDEGWRIRKDGSRFWANVVITAVHDSKGDLIGFGKVTRDLTERREAEEMLRRAHSEVERRVRERTAELQQERRRLAQANEELVAADRRKNQFLAMLAHELRNPLAPVRNALHVLRMPAAGINQRAAARDIMDRQVQHLTRLVDDLLDVSRFMQDRIELKREATDLRTVIERAVETAQPMISDRDQTLSISLPGRSVRVNVDIVRLSQAISNLLVNSAKFTEVGGRIFLSAEVSAGELVISVKDTGIGIAPDVLPHIFDLFMQADHSLERSQGGLGIGLNLVRKLVELHGGSVHAFSPGSGQGSEFVIRFPMELVDASSAEAPAATAPSIAPPAARRVLVVDDNIDAAESTAMLLRVSGHVVRVAFEGISALSEADVFHPDVVLLDIGLPQLDGYEVARRMRADPKHQSTILVAITGYGQPEDQQRSKSAGFDYHLTKPFDPDKLQAIIAAAG